MELEERGIREDKGTLGGEEHRYTEVSGRERGRREEEEGEEEEEQ